MAEPLKNSYGPDVPRRIARMIHGAWPRFQTDAFVRDVLEGYDALELMPRGWKIARTLRKYLPEDYPRAIRILMASIDVKLPAEPKKNALSSFLYMPYTNFVAEYGLAHFEESMQAQYELTQRFTAEYSIRRFLEHDQKKTLARLKVWAKDPSPHVRRLVSEGTRPRLPWAPRLRAFQKDPGPVLALLEVLKDDPDLYVRRSVANNLNDIGKDHPAVLLQTVKRWSKGVTPARQWLIRHALRSAIKRSDLGAMSVLGFSSKVKVVVRRARVEPSRVSMGGSVTASFEITNPSTRRQRVLADLRVHYVKADGKSRPKVFKLKTIELGGKETALLRKRISLVELTTRKHYPGRHRVELVVNGRGYEGVGFEVVG